MADNLNLYGNHRGGTAVVRNLPAPVADRFGAEWVLADPKEGRAEELAGAVARRFPGVRPTPLRMTAQEALRHSREADTLVLALDTVADSRETLALRGPGQRASFQLVGRGPGGTGGTRIGLSGMLVPGDRETEQRALVLLDTLDGMTRAASSRALTTADPLTAMVLQPMRERVTRHTVRHLAEKERAPWDLALGPLCVVLGATAYPLVPVVSTGQERYAHRRALALETAGVVPLTQWVDGGPAGRLLVVAVVIPEQRAVQFMRVAANRAGHRHLDGVTIFSPPPPDPRPAAPPAPAMFTD
jgi:hypothetical protein